MSSLVTVATCNLNQWALDFDANLERTALSIREAKAAGARYRLGPELELCGYGCEDHFLEIDTFVHCDESLAELLRGDLTDGILCDIGMPVQHRGVRYNCRVFCLDRKILLIRPKMCMADDGNYRETRWFTPWKRADLVEDHVLPLALATVTEQRFVPFGIAALHMSDSVLGAETCEELFVPQSPHINMSLAGVEIIGNGSGSHHQLRKLSTRLDLLCGATRKCGGVYLYANQRGCDGSRLYFDGCALIAINGEVIAQASQFSVREVETVCATVDLDDVRSYRGAMSSLAEQASSAPRLEAIMQPQFSLGTDSTLGLVAAVAVPARLHTAEEECARGPACWLWDYLRRSGAAGFFLALSGGADSASVAAIVGVMCNMVMEAVALGDARVIADVRRLTGSTELPRSPSELANYVLHTAYMGTENSSVATRTFAATLAEQIGSHHCALTIDTLVGAVVAVFETLTGRVPRFVSRGGTLGEDLALQNIQARLRMVIGYLLAQLLPWVRGRTGFLLVLGSANVDEALRGYLTKYDCSAADLNPIGAISKLDLKSMLRWAAETHSYTVLREIVEAPPTAELRPIEESSTGAEDAEGAAAAAHSQTDEADMGVTYKELGAFGRLRKISRCGPVLMFHKLLALWSHLEPPAVAEKVKHFFRYYSINRHKMCVLPPAYHAEQYSPDDNRFDQRQFLYNVRWPRQFRRIDELAKVAVASRAARALAAAD